MLIHGSAELRLSKLLGYFATLWANGDVSSRATEASVPPDDPKAKEERLRWAKKTLAEIEQMTQKERRMFLLERGHVPSGPSILHLKDSRFRILDLDSIQQAPKNIQKTMPGMIAELNGGVFAVKGKAMEK
ncbi:TPA_exp: hypothetical protein A8136_1394 [Trichophyton benhamiae CBS 112371]|nr:TPA_exp: hypothetical protein A8136_1394 [Trichophyton benhamiae CBS 112371]